MKAMALNSSFYLKITGSYSLVVLHMYDKLVNRILVEDL
jgi:hypothetical protein